MDKAALQNALVWTPPLQWQGSATCHLRHTEDEVFQYCIEHEYLLPDHCHEGRVVFVARTFRETSFMEHLDEFWQYWVSLPYDLSWVDKVFLTGL